jgi:NAD(P)-dependent dehydrogenase (short-subunit alcohol dehydrogenase family)
MSLYGMFKGVGESGYGYSSTAEEVTEGLDLSGKTYLLTGCSSGLGAETMRVLIARGARVIGAARSEATAASACRPHGALAVPLACELSEPASVRAAVATLVAQGVVLDGIIANAGIMALPTREVKLGCELQLLTNHIGHFLLVTGLIDHLAPTGRVVMLSSAAHVGTYREGIRLDDFAAERGYSAWGAYGQSKLANLLFARHLASLLPQPGQTANSVHPGVISTNLARHMNPIARSIFAAVGPALVLKSVGQGAATQCYVAVHPDAADVRGEYFADCNVARSSAFGRDDALAEALWRRTEEFVAGLP